MAVIPYDRITNLQNDQALAPTDPYPAQKLDQEYNALKITTDDIIQHLDLIQRDDGQLENDSVGLDQLREEVQIGFNAPHPWETDHDYVVGDTVFQDNKFWYCLVAHTSTDFYADHALGYWSLIADFTGAASVGAAMYVSDSPPVGPQHGAQWFESDTGNTYVFYNDGTSQQWIHTNGSASVPGGGGTFLQEGAGAVERTMQDKASDVFSVKDFGAIGDGIADDYAAIVAASAAAAAAGCALYLPGGIYNIGGNTFTPASGAHIFGDGFTNTYIKTISATANVINLAAGHITLANFQIASSVPRTGGSFINISGGPYTLSHLFLSAPFRGIILEASSSTVLLDDIYISNPPTTTGMGIEVRGGLLMQMRNVVIAGSAHAVGLYIANCGDITMVDCSFIGAVNNFQCVPTAGQVVVSILAIGCWFDQATSNNVLMIAAAGTGTINRCSFEGGWACGGAALSNTGFNLSGANIDGITITGMDIFKNSGGIAADGPKNLIISNNKIAGNTTGIALNNINGAVITGNKIGSTGGFGVDATGMNLSGTTGNIVISSNDFTGSTTPASVTAAIGSNISWTGNIGVSGRRAYTPTVSTGTGTITTLGPVSGGYVLAGKTCFWDVSIGITTNGTGGQDIRTNVPFVAAASALGVGREPGMTGVMLQAQVVGGTGLLLIVKADNSYPGANGAVLQASGYYEIT